MKTRHQKGFHTLSRAGRSDENRRSLVGKKSSEVSLGTQKRCYKQCLPRLGNRQTFAKMVHLTKMFHLNCCKFSLMNPFVLQGSLEQGIVLKDVVICGKKYFIMNGSPKSVTHTLHTTNCKHYFILDE